jgi:hypothetical protein
VKKNFVNIILTMMFFVGYVFIFDYFFRYIEMMFVPYGLLIFILQIGFSIVILRKKNNLRSTFGFLGYFFVLINCPPNCPNLTSVTDFVF